MPDDKDLPRRALVTGGAAGLGFAVAERLLATGAWVAIGDIDTLSLERAVKALNSPKLLPLVLDVTSRASVHDAVVACKKTFGGLDTLVNCAGIIDFIPLREMTEKQWDRVIDVDLKGVFLCCQAAEQLLRDSKRGRIVTMSSDAGKKGVALISSYCAAKFGVIGFSKAIAGELAPYGTTVNCVCPVGVSTTKMGQEVLDWLCTQTGQPVEAILAAREQTIPVGRMATLADVVHAVMFFISDEASFFTGEAINVDGGTLSTSLVPGFAKR
jgi:meso-butanediol dehydrogenase/(S,S)-butanediol dehydrogenase/diacetyl reductase